MLNCSISGQQAVFGQDALQRLQTQIIGNGYVAKPSSEEGPTPKTSPQWLMLLLRLKLFHRSLGNYLFLLYDGKKLRPARECSSVVATLLQVNCTTLHYSSVIREIIYNCVSVSLL